MKLVINTLKFQEMLSKSIKGASNNKLIPITGLLGISVKEGVLTLTTTDASNYLYIREFGVVGEDFEVCVPADLFYKLISKMTSENVELNLEPAILVLTVIGNGNYKIELPLDENGQIIRYPNPYMDLDYEDAGHIKKVYVDRMINSMKSSLATTLEIPCYTGYYIGDTALATDTYKIACLDEQLWSTPRLVSAQVIDLLSVMTSDTIDIRENKERDVLVFSSPDCDLYSVLMEGLEEYAYDAISELVSMEYDNSCTIPKNAILSLLDRLSLFVGPYDKNAIGLVFTKDKLYISSKSVNGTEILDYIKGNVVLDTFSCLVDIQMLISIIKSQKSTTVEIQYGLDNAIKILDEDIIYVLSLLDEEEEGNNYGEE